MTRFNKHFYVCFCILVTTFCCSPFLHAQTLGSNEIDSLKKRAKELKFDSPDSAAIICNKLIQHYKSVNNLDQVYSTQINLASCLSIQQKNNDALKIYESCLKYYTQKNDSVNLFGVFSGMAGVSYNLKDGKNVIAYLKMADLVCNANTHPRLKFINILNLENYYELTQQYDAAYKCCMDASKLLNTLNDSVATYQFKIKLTNLLYLKKQYKDAIENGLSILSYSNNSDKRVVMEAYSIVGSSYFALKDFKKSRSYLDSALTLSKRINSLRDYKEILQNKFLLDTSTNNQDGAINDLLKIIATNDSLYEINKATLTNDLLIKYRTERKEAENKILETENAKRSNIIKWQKVLIFVVAILSLIIIVFLFFYLRHRSLLQKKAIEEEKVGAELKALKAQLNPHFIQNIFQIISNQVKINPSAVSDFLQKTSEYFRSVLNGSDISVQSLEDELIFTEKYLDFQQSLFENKLTYEIHVDKEVDTFGILIPAMLLQPFVENSIKYGLQLYQKTMHIDLKFSVDKSYLNISITDNGNFLVNDTIINNKSFGNALIEKRMLLFYKNYKIKPQLISQKKDNDSGFIVNIKLPLHK